MYVQCCGCGVWVWLTIQLESLVVLDFEILQFRREVAECGFYGLYIAYNNIMPGYIIYGIYTYLSLSNNILEDLLDLGLLRGGLGQGRWGLEEREESRGQRCCETGCPARNN